MIFTQCTYQMIFCQAVSSDLSSATLEPNAPTCATCLSYTTVNGIALSFKILHEKYKAVTYTSCCEHNIDKRAKKKGSSKVGSSHTVDLAWKTASVL